LIVVERHCDEQAEAPGLCIGPRVHPLCIAIERSRLAVT
jgi:hypothetical protein